MARVVAWSSLKPNWEGSKTLYLVQNVINRCLIIVSNISLNVERIDIRL